MQLTASPYNEIERVSWYADQAVENIDLVSFDLEDLGKQGPSRISDNGKILPM